MIISVSWLSRTHNDFYDNVFSYIAYAYAPVAMKLRFSKFFYLLLFLNLPYILKES